MSAKSRNPGAGYAGAFGKFDRLGGSICSEPNATATATQAQPISTTRAHIAKAICAELIGSNQAGAAEIVATGHAPVLKLCRALLEAGHDPALPLEVYRGTILCLRVRSIGEGAALTVEDSATGRPRFVRHRPRTYGAAPPIAPSGEGL